MTRSESSEIILRNASLSLGLEALKGGWLYYNDNDLFAQTQWMIILAKVHITYKIIVIDYANSTEPLNTMQKHSLSKHLDWLG